MNVIQGTCFICYKDVVLLQRYAKKAQRTIVSLFLESNINISQLNKEADDLSVCPICYYKLELLCRTARDFVVHSKPRMCSLCNESAELVPLDKSDYFRSIIEDYQLSNKNVLCPACLFYLHFRYTVKQSLIKKCPKLKLNLEPKKKSSNFFPHNLDLRAIKKLKPLKSNKLFYKSIHRKDLKLFERIPFVKIDLIDLEREMTRPRIKIKLKRSKYNQFQNADNMVEEMGKSKNVSRSGLEKFRKRKADDIINFDPVYEKKGKDEMDTILEDVVAKKKKKKRVSFKEGTDEIIDKHYTYDSTVAQMSDENNFYSDDCKKTTATFQGNSDNAMRDLVIRLIHFNIPVISNPDNETKTESDISDKDPSDNENDEDNVKINQTDSLREKKNNYKPKPLSKQKKTVCESIENDPERLSEKTSSKLNIEDCSKEVDTEISRTKSPVGSEDFVCKMNTEVGTDDEDSRKLSESACEMDVLEINNDESNQSQTLNENATHNPENLCEPGSDTIHSQKSDSDKDHSISEKKSQQLDGDHKKKGTLKAANDKTVDNEINEDSEEEKEDGDITPLDENKHTENGSTNGSNKKLSRKNMGRIKRKQSIFVESVTLESDEEISLEEKSKNDTHSAEKDHDSDSHKENAEGESDDTRLSNSENKSEQECTEESSSHDNKSKKETDEFDLIKKYIGNTSTTNDEILSVDGEDSESVLVNGSDPSEESVPEDIEKINEKQQSAEDSCTNVNDHTTIEEDKNGEKLIKEKEVVEDKHTSSESDKAIEDRRDENRDEKVNPTDDSDK